MAQTQPPGRKARARSAAPPATALVSSPAPAPPGGRELLAIGVPLGIWLLATIVVAAAVRLPGIVPSGNETTWDRAIFTAVNAATLTGFQQTMGVREMAAASMGGPILLFALTLIGTFTTLFVGGLAAAGALRTAHTARQIAAAAAVAQSLATIGGGAALINSSRDIFTALFQAASAFGNSGLWLGALPTTTSAATHAILLPLALLGGLGLPVLIDLSNWVFGKSSLSRYSRIVITLSAAVYLGGFVMLLLAQISAASTGGWPAWRNTLASCTTAAINARTAGLPMQSPAAFTGAGQWVLIALMLIGAAPAGTAGGLKVTTLWQLVTGTRDALAGRTARRLTGIAIVWAGFYALSLFVGMLFLVGTEAQSATDRLLFMAVSALSNVGLSHDPVSITGAGLLVLSVLMIIGRLAPLAVLWWAASIREDTDVLVG